MSSKLDSLWLCFHIKFDCINTQRTKSFPLVWSRFSLFSLISHVHIIVYPLGFARKLKTVSALSLSLAFLISLETGMFSFTRTRMEIQHTDISRTHIEQKKNFSINYTCRCLFLLIPTCRCKLIFSQRRNIPKKVLWES